MSAITRSFKRIAAEIAYSTNNQGRADLYVTEIAAERITQTLQNARPDKSFTQNINLAAFGRGVEDYRTIMGELEARLKPGIDECARKGLEVSLKGFNSSDIYRPNGPAVVKVKVCPFTQGSGLF